MSVSNVVPLVIQPTKEELLARVRELAANSANIDYNHKHAKERMEQRKIGMREVLETIRNGEIVDEPRKEGDDWRLKLGRFVAGSHVEVVVAIKPRHIALVTVI